MIDLFKDHWLPYSKPSIESFGFTIMPKESRELNSIVVGNKSLYVSSHIPCIDMV
jgi:hypothetical protein